MPTSFLLRLECEAERDKQEVRDRRDTNFEVPTPRTLDLEPTPVPLFLQVSQVTRKASQSYLIESVRRTVS